MPTNDAKGTSAQKTAGPTAKPISATTSLSASGQAAATGDQSSNADGSQTADVFQRAPATSQPLGAPSTGLSQLDQLRKDDPTHPLVSATRANEEPRGDQAKPALMTPSGSLPIGMTPGTDAHAIARVTSSPFETPQDDSAGYRPHHRLPREFLNTLGRAQLLAVAQDRGYKLESTGGRRVLVNRFIECQDKDDSLTDHPRDVADDKVVSTADTAPTARDVQ